MGSCTSLVDIPKQTQDYNNIKEENMDDVRIKHAGLIANIISQQMDKYPFDHSIQFHFEWYWAPNDDKVSFGNLYTDKKCKCDDKNKHVCQKYIDTTGEMYKYLLYTSVQREIVNILKTHKLDVEFYNGSTAMVSRWLDDLF